ncbi:hypothetical protein ACMATS_06015 [Streptoverticillium reticulum]|uniref:hypothetical protein n=1 Tax=Streptoverticillium reticulum TaxID=1433415 RepID=UPI0039BF06F1
MAARAKPRIPKITRHDTEVLGIDPASGQARPTGRRLVIASAALVSRDQVHTVISRPRDWQREAWELYDSIPELHFSLEWQANACSRVRLYAGRVDPDGSTAATPVDESDTDADKLLAPLAELFGGQVGQAEVIRRLVSHLQIPGETYLVGFDDKETKKRRWIVVSGEEIGRDITGENFTAMLPDRPEKVTLDVGTGKRQDVMIRIWRPHPKVAIDPDSALIPLRSVLRQIQNLDAHITAASDSRLAGAGILAVPDELSSPDERQSEGHPNPLHPDPFSHALMEAMLAPLKNRDAASAVTPLIVRGPAEAIDKIKHISLATPFDAKVSELREQAFHRMATGLDIPKEIITGISNANHWNAWNVDEQFVKVAVASIMGLIAEALTTQFYRPALRALGIEEADSFAIGVDLSPLSQRPNRAPEALQAHERGVLSDEALLREIGFDLEDYPDEEERHRRLLEKLVLANPSLAAILLPDLGIDIKMPPTVTPLPTGRGRRARAVLTRADQAEPAAEETPRDEIPGKGQPPEQQDGAEQQPATGEQRPRPALASAAPVEEEQPAGQAVVEVEAEPDAEPEESVPEGETDAEAETAPAPLPDAETVADGSYLKAAACAEEWRANCLEVGVLRALARAGQWLLNAHGRIYRGRLRDVPLHDMHTVLAAQENWLNAMLADAYPELTASLAHRPCMVGAVDKYVRALIIAQLPHHRDYLAAVIEQSGCGERRAA